ncbi:MAG: acyl-CoA synthetase [Rhodospirillales bacterium 70-18]|nr:AMP-binding protein [Rhodospirillales bacterium]OJY70519.1 MAG: acyl-CoA synthetase [Rhodospirillales bacterium 70-18]
MTDAHRIRRNTIADAVHRAATHFGDRTALTFGDRAWSFRALDEAAGRIGRHLLSLGLTRGDRVAAYGRNSDAYVLLWLACVRVGLVHVPVNYALTGEELTYIVGQSGAAALVCDAALEANLAPVRELGGVRHYLDFAALPALARDPAIGPDLDVDVAETDLAQLLYTSGTTALPKGAAMSHAALLAEYTSCILALELTAADRSIAALPLYHSAQMHCFLMPSLLVGAATLLLPAPAAETVLELIERHRMTTFFAPPTVWISLLRHPDFARRDLSSLKSVFYGASIMPVPVLEELRARLPEARPFNCYGQSEIGPLATVLKPEDHDARPGSVGRPIFNVQTRVVDAAMNDAGPGVQGEIVHRSPQLLVGYWDKPEATDDAFAGGWFHSGDVGYFDADGFLFIVDRIKDVINTGGVLVASRDVEEALFTHPAVSEVAVIALPDPKWIEAITAVVVLRPGMAATEEELVAHARRHLAPFKLPKRIIFAEDLPRNTAGKLLKRELRRVHGAATPWS